jgi:Cdc6-like AAA superfamily ATPase
MPHRHADLHELSTALNPVGAGDGPDNARIVGPSGSGKTTLAKFALRKFERAGDGDLEWHHVNCLQYSSPASILYECVCALPDVGPGEFNLRSDPKTLYVNRLRDHATPFVAVLDEATDVDETTVFQMLTDIPGVAVWAVAHSDAELLARTRTSVASRLRNGPRLELARYTDDELVDILADRLPSGESRPVTDAALAEVADRAAGNARTAIWIAEHAVEHADAMGTFPVDVATVEHVSDDAERDLRQHNVIQRLDTEHRVIHRILTEDGELSGPEVHERLEERMGAEYRPRKRRAFLAKLAEYDAVEKHGEKRGATYVARPLR